MDTNREIIGVMFPEKFEFDGETYRTNSYNKVLDLIYLQTNELRGQKKRDSSDFPEKSLQVPPQGPQLRYLQLRNRVLNIDIPPKSPFGKGGLRQGSRSPKGIQKKEDLPIFLL